MVKIALVLPGNYWLCPYVRNYTTILDDQDVNYDIISWNRDGKEGNIGIQYQEVQDNSVSKIRKVLPFFHYISFIKRTLTHNKYDKVVVFGPHLGIPLFRFLRKHYRNRYIFDYRDLSIEQYVLLKYPFAELLRHSFANVISSPGFKRCLPDESYYISHNFDAKAAKESIEKEDVQTHFNVEKPIKILTIGRIRDYESNVEIVDALNGNTDFLIQFVGDGPAAEPLKRHSEEQNATNIDFKGFYQKEEEKDFVAQATFMNIYYPRLITHDTALSNRFYNSLIYRRPMIVTKDTCQGDFATQYQVGVAISDCSSLAEELQNFLAQDFGDYTARCNKLLKLFMKDQEQFEQVVRDFAGKCLKET